ncbi:EAL domain-containing protein [Thiocapsa bogorovii]|uniref:EAL domain-containing protein n=1 Tax=Thiocapsa bogorovii TaxID=521689 RepID=UPI001E6097CB|nr:EAL domain-containing protein [Thiocapsa bogorovii]UHD18531.1 EAL domain-containing protein [Thiocapsa bogorovii]
MRGRDKPKTTSSLTIAIATLLGALVLSAAVIINTEQQRVQLMRADNATLAKEYANTIADAIKHAMSSTHALAALVEQGQGKISDFQEFGKAMLPHYPGIDALFLAPDGVIRDVFPRAGNESVIGLDLLKDPVRDPDTMTPRDTGHLTLSSASTLIRSTTGIIGSHPVFIEDAQGNPVFWGFALARLPFPDALAPSGLSQLGERGIAYRLWTGTPATGDVQIIEASSVEPVSPVEAQVAVPNTKWTLSLSPIDGWGDPFGLAVRAGLGLLFSLLLATLAKLLADARTQKARLAMKLAERTAEIRAREAELERAEEIAQVGSWDFDIRSNRAIASAVACRITGVSPNTHFSLERFLAQVHPLDRTLVQAAWQAALRGEPYDVEHRTLVAGRLRWLRQRAVLEFDNDGRALRAAGTVEDITARKRAEQALSDSESRLRRIVETAREGIWTIDGDIRTTFVNPRMIELLGCPAEQIIGRSPFDFMDPEMRQLVERKLLERRQGISDQYELRLRRPDGSPLWTLLSTTPLKDDEGRYIGTLGMLTDISARKQAEAILEEERLLLKQAERIANIGAWEWEVAEDRWTHSTGWTAIHGIAGQLPQSTAEMLAIIPTDERDAVQDALEAALDGRRPFDIEHRIIRPIDGVLRRIHAVGEVIRNHRGEALAMRGIARDITASKEAEAELRIAAIAFEAQEGMLVTDAEEHILRVNEAFTRNTGYTAEEVIGRNPRLLRSGRHDPDFFAEMWARISDQGYWQGEIWNRRKNGEVFPEWLTVTAVRDDLGHVTHYVGTLTDISQRKEDEAVIRRLAFYDPLTGLANRRLLLDRLNQTLAAAARTGQDGALIFIDLDNFKQLNDTRGHQVGDLLLEEVAHRLTETVRKSDSVARLGGDEFVVLLQDLGDDSAQAAALAEAVGEKIITVLGRPYMLAGKEHESTPSLGIAMFDREPHTAEEILKHADLAMYQAKAAGRNRLRFYDPKMQASVNQRAALERELRHAIGDGQLVLHYQSQVDGQGHVSGAEALLRWRHPERGLIPPAQFIGLAESLGLALPLGRWVLASACAQLAEWARRPETAGLNLAVNISGAHFRRPELVEDIRRALAESGANPKRLRLELAEATLLDDPDDSLAKMIALKETGVGFTLDNFGSGYCSLSYLKRLPLDQLKIAPAFVHEVLEGSEDDATADSFVALAESLGLAIMAEGVETEAQRDYLAHHGCQIFQGFLFGLPGPADALFPGRSTSEPQRR